MTERIEPGKGVGKLRLGMTLVETVRILGKPKDTQPVLKGVKTRTGYVWRVWEAPTKSKEETPEWSLAVVADKSAKIVQVHVRGQRYATAEGHSTNTPFATLRRVYRRLEVQEAPIIDDPSGAGYVLYIFTERAAGISFLHGTQDDIGSIEALQKGTLAPETLVIHAAGRLPLPLDGGAFANEQKVTESARKLQRLLR